MKDEILEKEYEKEVQFDCIEKELEKTIELPKIKEKQDEQKNEGN